MKHQDLISKMTLEEKASLCSGKDFWHLKGLEKFNIPEIMVCDGPHGLRKQTGSQDNLGINGQRACHLLSNSRHHCLFLESGAAA